MTLKLSDSHFVNNQKSDFITTTEVYNNHFELFCGNVLVLFITTAFRLHSRWHFFCTILILSTYWLLVLLFHQLLKPFNCFNVLRRCLHSYCRLYRNLQASFYEWRLSKACVLYGHEDIWAS